MQFTLFSFLWLLLSLLLGLGYAFILYRQHNSFTEPLRRWLFLLRTAVVSLICFLLFAPYIRQSNKTIEKPVILFAQDNSASIALSKPKDFNISSYSEGIRDLQKRLSSRYNLHTFTIGAEVREGKEYHFNEQLTGLSDFFQYISHHYASQNVGAVVLATDGIYNKGGNPLYDAKTLKAPVFTIALGDTVPRKDLLIANVHYNTTVYTGNDFQVEVSVEAYESKGKNTTLTVTEGGRALLQKSISITSDEYHETIPLTLPGTKKGIHHYSLKLSALEGELSTRNNQDDFYVEMLDGKQKVLIWAAAPHPDITAMRQALESNKNYEVSISITTVNNEDLRNADLVILHQIPSVSRPLKEQLSLLRNKALFFILGAQSDIASFSRLQNVLEISNSGGSGEVTAAFNNSFFAFSAEEEQMKEISNSGPLVAPSGTYRIKSPASVMFYQNTKQAGAKIPLLVFSEEGGRKTGVLAGEGFWRWRLNEFRQNESHQLTDLLLARVVQYLSAKEDKRKLRVYPARNTFDENEHVILNAELYNDANELVNKPDVSITLRAAGKRSYSFIFSKTSNAYILDAGVLPFGEYSFTAFARLGDLSHKAEGRFIVSRQSAEFRQTTANHQILNALSRESGGKMIFPSQMNALDSLIARNELVKDISYENRRLEELINLKWIFFLITLLLSAEWFIRKRNGSL